MRYFSSQYYLYFFPDNMILAHYFGLGRVETEAEKLADIPRHYYPQIT